jgi:hypothetical protein
MPTFRLPSGVAAPHAGLAGSCVEIVFVGIRLCDRLVYAGAALGMNVRSCRPYSAFDDGLRSVNGGGITPETAFRRLIAP